MELPPSPPPVLPTVLASDDFQVDPELAEAGGVAYAGKCLLCHGAGAVSGGVAPDLRASAIVLSRAAFEEVVKGGRLRANGMSACPDLTPDELERLRHYIRSQVPRVHEGGTM